MELHNVGTRVLLASLCGVLVPSGVLAAAKVKASAVPAAETPAPKVDVAAVDEARRELDSNLLDYPRARFRAVRLVHGSMSFRAFCGDINVTNRMGGYNGWHAFVLPLGEEGTAGLYDKPTIEGQTTKMASFFNQYGTTKIDDGATGRLIEGVCGSEAKPFDNVDYADSLTYKSGH